MLPYLVFPTLMSASLGLTWVLLGQGVPASFAGLPAVLLFGFLGIFILERKMPYRQDWLNNDNDVGTDWVHMVVGQLIIPRLWTPLQIVSLTGITIWLTESAGQTLWPDDWPILAQLFLMLLIAEFGRYWVHRAAHRINRLWRFHAVHHSPNRLYFFNAGRFHPVEKLLFQLPEVAPFIILGTNAECIAMYFTFNGIHGLLQHSNIHIKAGWLNYVFSMTELHRWHHSQKPEESDNNYGNNLIIWDLIFGTYLNPKQRELDSIGLLNPGYPKRYIGQLKAPFANRDISKPEDYKSH